MRLKFKSLCRPIAAIVIISGITLTYRSLTSSTSHQALGSPEEQPVFPSQGLVSGGQKKGTVIEVVNNKTCPRIKLPRNTNIYDYSRSLHIGAEVVQETQSVHEQLFRHILVGRTKAIIFDVYVFENKGDLAIILGQLYLLARLDVEIVFYCDYFCKQKDFQKALGIVRQYDAADVVILTSGGGNFGAWPKHDHIRFELMEVFVDYKIIVFPQSAFFHDDKHLEKCITEYSKHQDLVFLIRDEPSYKFTQEHFPEVCSILVPDIAWNIGVVKRFMPPLYDVVWLTRTDWEVEPNKKAASLPPGITFVKHDFRNEWPTPVGANLLENSALRTRNGFLFLLQGRVLISDRLHGFIMAQFLNIPTVVIDNKIKKLSNYHNTWTNGLDTALLATDDADAVQKALQLLQKFNDTVPAVAHKKLFADIHRGQD